MDTANEKSLKFEQFMQIKGMDSLTFEQKEEKLNALGISYYIKDGYLVYGRPDMEEEEADTTSFSILQCMSEIIEDLKVGSDKDRKFNKGIYKSRAKEIEYVCKMCGTTAQQAVILACIIEQSGRRNLSKETLADYMGMSYIKLLSFDSDIRALHEKRFILSQKDGDLHLPSHVIPTLSRNEPYHAPNISGLGTTGVLKVLKAIFKQRIDEDMDEDDMMEQLDELMENNTDCQFVKVATQYKVLGTDKVNYMERVVFYNLVYRYLYEDDDVVGWHNYEDIFEDESDINSIRSHYKRGEMELQTKGVIESTFEDGFADADYFHIKDEIKEQLFEEVGGLRKKSRRGGKLKILPTSQIQTKAMFYNPEEERQIGRLSSLLNEATYKDICNRLKDSGLRTGFSCIFYGSPGTGKTETAYQLAKSTGRAIVPVNVSEIKSCWVGESEKLIKGVFDKYRHMVEDSDIAPILLFNEADAIFGIRKEAATDAVDKMENSIQNIILQEMEKMDGILIATTNLTENLDKAFERRFLYKIKFDKPSLEAKGKIWKSLLPSLSEQQAEELARGYDFSGGQIENISRKKVIQSIIDGKEPDFAEVKSYCGEELIDNKNRIGKRIGY